MITYCPRCGTQFREDFKGEWFETGVRCAECAVTVTEPPAMLSPAGPEEEVEYDLAQWEMPERIAATAALLDVDIPYRWEQNLVLVVPGVAEDEVDRLLDDLDDDSADVDEDEVDAAEGGEEAQAAMGDLFVAADRLQHDPADDRMAADAMEAATTVESCRPPYGIARPVWRQIQGLASTLASDLEASAPEETVAADARALREYLRDLV